MACIDPGGVQLELSMAQPLLKTVQLALLPHVAAGDAAAMKHMIERYGRLIWSMACRFERETAEDAVQEVFIDLWKSAERYDANVAKESTFVMMIARRRLIDRRRRRAVQPAIDYDNEMLTLADHHNAPADVAAYANATVRAIEQLSAGQRDVLLLSICYGMSHQDIAEKLAIPLGTVKAHARRGMLAVKAVISADVEEVVP